MERVDARHVTVASEATEMVMIMKDHIENIVEEMSSLGIGINESSKISLNDIRFDSWDSELKDHELNCFIHHDKLVMAKRALEIFRASYGQRSRSLHSGFASDWPKELHYKILKINYLFSITPKFEKIKNAESRSKNFAYEALNETVQSYRHKIWDEIRELRNDRQKLVNIHNEQGRRIMSDPLNIAAFVKNEDAIAARQNDAERIENLKRQEEFLDNCQHEQNHFTVGINRGERNHELHKLYSKELATRVDAIDKFETRLKNYIEKLEKSAPQDYDSFKASVMDKREKARLAEEKKKKAEEAKKRKSEKKAYDSLMKKLSSTGLGLREMSSDGKEKRAYVTEAEAQKAAIASSGKSGQYITVYSKSFRLLDGADAYGTTHTFWFLTSNKSVTKAA